ncbi:hypothetical protein [Serratia marcescens]|uniref:hypothetical protein n=1 Tax=Serratia marcescens TaxID=615 RepID=UPI000F7EDBE7|nr:hypothetical protein [Serratia marcescens]UTL85638.1 hypothetical protein NLX77_22445 [Serratia marcescens]UYY67234.1 hypothetical protein OKB57_22495 [Serratia marcescens]
MLMNEIILSFACFARAESWVEVQSTDKQPESSLYRFTYSYSWPYENTELTVPECQYGCMVLPFYEGGQIYQMQSDALIIRPEDNCQTTQCIWGKWVAAHGKGLGTSSLLTAQQSARESCWAFMVFPFGGGFPTEPGVRIPGAFCGVAPPP